jgi:hypothetical protein
MDDTFDAAAEDIGLRRHARALPEGPSKVKRTQPNAIGQAPIADGFAQMGLDFGVHS